EIYRDKLRHDVNAMHALNGVVALQPDNRPALDALTTHLEHMKRWPDLIAALQKKAAASGDPVEQVELFTRVATLFQEKFSNAAEARRALHRPRERSRARDHVVEGVARRRAGEQARPGRAEEALHGAEALGGPRAVLRAAGQVRRVPARPRAAGGERGRQHKS